MKKENSDNVWLSLAPIPKEKMAECMKIINNTVAHLPISVGDVIIEDVFGADIVAARNMK